MRPPRPSIPAVLAAALLIGALAAPAARGGRRRPPAAGADERRGRPVDLLPRRRRRGAPLLDAGPDARGAADRRPARPRLGAQPGAHRDLGNDRRSDRTEVPGQRRDLHLRRGRDRLRPLLGDLGRLAEQERRDHRRPLRLRRGDLVEPQVGLRPRLPPRRTPLRHLHRPLAGDDARLARARKRELRRRRRGGRAQRKRPDAGRGGRRRPGADGALAGPDLRRLRLSGRKAVQRRHPAGLPRSALRGPRLRLASSNRARSTWRSAATTAPAAPAAAG